MKWNACGSNSFSAHDDFTLNFLRTPSRSPGSISTARANWATAFLSDKIETMIRREQRSRLALSNRAISAYQRHRSSGEGLRGPAACSSA
jgi:hypothetical protein